ncbi:MAG: hypothetical protein U0694_06580 [Anaerolineae bacterium]
MPVMANLKWRFDLEEAGAGVVGDLGSHWLYLAQWCWRNPGR